MSKLLSIVFCAAFLSACGGNNAADQEEKFKAACLLNFMESTGDTDTVPSEMKEEMEMTCKCLHRTFTENLQDGDVASLTEILMSEDKSKIENLMDEKFGAEKAVDISYIAEACVN